MIEQFRPDVTPADDTWIVMDCEHDSRVLLLTFAARGKVLHKPGFEFVKISQPYPVKRIFVRDLADHWYHAGLGSATRNVVENAAFLRTLVDAQNVDRLVVTGSSSGGYAALLHGTLMQADIVLGFAPQTFIDWWHRLIYGEKRSKHYIPTVWRANWAHRRYFDVKPHLKQNTRTRFDIHYPARHKVDPNHARRLKGLPNVTLYPHDTDDHRLTLILRDSGQLEPILTDALGVRPSAAADA